MHLEASLWNLKDAVTYYNESYYTMVYGYASSYIHALDRCHAPSSEEDRFYAQLSPILSFATFGDSGFWYDTEARDLFSSALEVIHTELRYDDLDGALQEIIALRSALTDRGYDVPDY